MSDLSSLTQALKEQADKVQEEVSKLQSALDERKSDLDKIQGAIEALEPPAKPGRKKRNAPSKPSASKSDL